MKKIVLLIFLFVASVFQLEVHSKELMDRVGEAQKSCFNSRYSFYGEVSFNPPRENYEYLYKVSRLQRFLSPGFIALVDNFGGDFQGVIAGDDTVYVDYYLKALAQDARKYRREENLNIFKSICVASCITNNLMEADPDINPFTSMELAISKGRGFCRHYALTTEKILEKMRIKVEREYSVSHMFLKFRHQGETYFFDPSFADGMVDCNFMKQ